MQTSEKIANAINNAIAETNESNMFVTLFIGVLDLKEGMLDYCNACHNPPLISNGKVISEHDGTDDYPSCYLEISAVLK